MASTVRTAALQRRDLSAVGSAAKCCWNRMTRPLWTRTR